MSSGSMFQAVNKFRGTHHVSLKGELIFGSDQLIITSQW